MTRTFGCGTRRSTLLLTDVVTQETITAVDAFALIVGVLCEAVERRGLSTRVRCVVGDMLTEPILPPSVGIKSGKSAMCLTNRESPHSRTSTELRIRYVCLCLVSASASALSSRSPPTAVSAPLVKRRVNEACRQSTSVLPTNVASFDSSRQTALADVGD